MAEKHELADKYIREVERDYPPARRKGQTVVAIALIRACEDLLIERHKIDRFLHDIGFAVQRARPGQRLQDAVSEAQAKGDAIVPGTPVSLDLDPSSQAVFAGDGPESSVACPNCETLNPLRNINGDEWYLCHYCDYMERR